MNLTDTQKEMLVPASVGAATYAILCEFVFTKGKSCVKNSLLGAAAAAVVSGVAYKKADAATKAKLDPYLLPAGAAAATLLAGDYLIEANIVKGIPRVAGIAAAAGAGFLTYKELSEPSTPAVSGYLGY